MCLKSLKTGRRKIFIYNTKGGNDTKECSSVEGYNVKDIIIRKKFTLCLTGY